MVLPVNISQEDEHEEMCDSETGDMSEEGYVVQGEQIRPVYVLSTDDMQIVDANNFMGEDIVERSYQHTDIQSPPMTCKRGRGRPKGTTAARGYKVSPGRPAGSSHKRSDIKSEPGESSNEGTSSLDAKPDSTTPSKRRGRRKGTTRANGFKVSTGRPVGTTRQNGYKVSTGRPKKKQENLMLSPETSLHMVTADGVVITHVKSESTDYLPDLGSMK